MAKGWVVCPCMTKTLGSSSSGVTSSIGGTDLMIVSDSDVN